MQSGRCAGDHHLYNLDGLQDVENSYRLIISFNVLLENYSMQSGRCAGEL